LCDLEQCITDPVTISDTHNVVGQPFDGEVLAKLPVDEAGPFQLLLPIVIRFDLIDEDGALLTAMASEVALTVSL
jgi:hypothetical protein